MKNKKKLWWLALPIGIAVLWYGFYTFLNIIDPSLYDEYPQGSKKNEFMLYNDGCCFILEDFSICLSDESGKNYPLLENSAPPFGKRLIANFPNDISGPVQATVSFRYEYDTAGYVEFPVMGFESLEALKKDGLLLIFGDGTLQVKSGKLEELFSYDKEPWAALESEKNGQEDENVTNKTDYDPNPYEGYSENPDYWRYDLFEIFRGVETVSFDDRLDYEKDYSQVITYEKQDDVLHEFKCKISLPQAAGIEPWAENINAYYQKLLPELIAYGDETWDLYYDDWAIHELSYYFETAYKHENIITVVRSCNFYGWRPSISWEPFTELFSAIDGQKLYLDDLFCVERNEYLSVLLELLSDATLYGTDYKPALQSEIVNRLDDASVAVTKTGLVFIFPTGAVSDMASGVVFLNVTYEDLQGLLNPNYFPNRVDDITKHRAILPARYDYTDADLDIEIHVEYLQIAGLADTKKQARINAALYEIVDMFKYDEETELELTNYSESASVSYSVIGADIMSVQYATSYDHMMAAHPSAGMDTVTIDLRTGEKLRLSDILILNDDFQKILNAEMVDETRMEPQVLEFYEDVYKELYESIIESYSEDSGYYYLTENAIGFILYVPHVVGDYWTFEIAYEDITDFLTPDFQSVLFGLI